MVDNNSNDKICEEFKKRLQSRIPDVKRELLRIKNGPQIPHVKSDCPEQLRELAERLVVLQVENGEYRREDIETSDMYKIKQISKLTGVSFRDVIDSLVENSTYVNYEVIDARHIIKLLSEFDEAYETFYPKYNAFPMNVLSTETRCYLKPLARGLSKQQKLETIIEVFRPHLFGIDFVEHNYEVMPKSRIVLTEENIEVIRAELSSIAESGNIDVIFSKKYEPYFKNLCSRLKLSGYTFDRFINEHTNLTYTMCFKADIIPAVKQMVLHFKSMYGTTRGMTERDPYLRNKVEAAQSVAGLYTTKELFELFGIDTDSPDNSARVLSKDELIHRDKVLVAELARIYPDGMMQKGFATNYNKLYTELTILYKRLGYEKIDDYLADRGIVRVVDKKSTETCVYLSERDLYKYEFLKGCQTPEEIDERLKSFGISLVGPYENLGIYRKLAYEGQDGTYCESSVRKFE